MRRHLRRVAALTFPLLLGMLIGFASNEAASDGSGRAEATKPAKTGAKKAETVKRVGSVVGLNREKLEEYVILHKHVWPQVLERIRKSNIRNYSIYLGELDDGKLYLFSYFEYVGSDFDADMEAIGDDPATQQWWKLTDPLQKRVKGTPKDDQWKTMKEVFHTD